MKRVCTPLSSSNSMTFHDFFNDLFKFSKTLGLVVTFKNFQNFPSFGVFFEQFNRHKLWNPPKWVPFALFNNSTPLYLTLSSLCHLQ